MDNDNNTPSDLAGVKAKEVQEPWLEWIASGSKTYEGRLKRGLWGELSPGDKLMFHSAQRRVLVEVTEILPFPDFGAAYASLKDKLIPAAAGVRTEEQARQTYRQWFLDGEVREFGVVAVGVKALVTHPPDS